MPLSILHDNNVQPAYVLVNMIMLVSITYSPSIQSSGMETWQYQGYCSN